MFRSPGEHEENRGDYLLRQGLRSLPVPETSPDFNARVHAALRRPAPWWRTIWNRTRPVLATAACSLLVTLALLKGSNIAGTVSPLQAQPIDRNALMAHRDRERDAAIEVAVERDDLSAASLQGFVALRQPIRLR